jgi:hypothetical protein
MQGFPAEFYGQFSDYYKNTPRYGATPRTFALSTYTRATHAEFTHCRNPENTELAPWVAPIYKRTKAA